MSIYNVHLADYMASFKPEFHSELKVILRSFPQTIDQLGNVCFYGPGGIGKYTQALHAISRYSPSSLKYERKLQIENGKSTIAIKISDVHFEIDFGLLGCNAKSIWHAVWMQFKDVLEARGAKRGIVLCKNVHEMHGELLECFYGYMQTKLEDDCHLVYFLLTEHVSFLPTEILSRCFMIPIKRPTPAKYKAILEGKKVTSRDATGVVNIKDLAVGNTQLKCSFDSICNKIYTSITTFRREPNYVELRETLYDLLIFNFDVHAFYQRIIERLIREERLSEALTLRVMDELPTILMCFNNNYRPIYHLERFCFFLISTIDGGENE